MENIESNFIHLETANLSAFRQRIRLRAHVRMVLAMLASDVFGIFIAVMLASLLRWVVMGPLSPSAFTWLPVYLVIFFMAAWLRGLYPAVGISAVDQFRHLTIVTSLFYLVIIALTFLFQISAGYSRLLIFLSWFFCLVTVPFNRTIIRHFLAKLDLWGESVVIIGHHEDTQRVATYFKQNPKIGLRPELLLNLNDEMDGRDQSSHTALLQCIDKMKVSNPSIHTALVAYNSLDEFTGIREAFRDLFEKVILISPNDKQLDLGGVTIHQYGDLLTFEIRHSLIDPTAQFEKRVIDLCGAGFGLLLLSPLLALISLLIAVDSPGGVFYRQRRFGKNGKEFDMLKFRTMKQDADAVLQQFLAANPTMRQEWDCYQKLHLDPRITRVGRLLRRFSLDELPQLWNVLLGEMSIVGPRPIMLNQCEMYGTNYCHYIRVVPGITGLWQISGRNRTSFAQRTAFDVEYVNNWSIWVDIYIIVRTVWVVLRRDGAC